MAAAVQLFRYHLNNADSGTPAEPIADSVSGINLTPTYLTPGSVEVAHFMTSAGGRGVEFTQTQGAADGGQLLSGSITALNPAMSGATEGWWAAKIRIDATTGEGTVFVLGHQSGGDGLMRLTIEGNDTIRATWASEDSDGATQYYRVLFYNGGPFAAGEHVFIIQVVSTEAVQNSRARCWRNGTELTSVIEHLIPQNLAMRALTANDRISIGTRATRANQAFQGAIKCVMGGVGTLTSSQITTISTNLAANDDADPLAAPTLAFLATPSVDQETTTSIRISLTTNLAAAVRILGFDDIAAANPGAAAFSAVASLGTTAPSTVFRTTLTGLASGTERRYWVQINDGTTIQYASVQGTTQAATSQIISVNGGQPLRYGQTAIPVVWAGGATGTTATLINGVAQANHTVVDDNLTTFDFVWPAPCMYDETKQLTIGAASIQTPIILPPVGHAHYTLVDYVENPPRTIDFATALGDPNGVAQSGDQYVFSFESGQITGNDKAELAFSAGFDGTVTVAIVDHVDGTHSPFVELTYGGAVDNIPTIPALSNLTGQEANTPIVDSFLCADVDAGVDVQYAALGAMLVGLSATGPWVAQVTRQLGQTVYHRMITGNYGESVTGGVSSGGQSQSCTYTTRAANAPTFTQQPTPNPAYAVVGGQISFSATAVNAASLQWLIDGDVVPGATQIPFVYTPTQVGTFGVQLRATSLEGASSLSNIAQLVVSPSLAKIELGPFYSDEDETVLLANHSIQARIRNAAGTLVVPQTAYLTSGLGTLVIASAAIGTPGAKVFFEYMVPGSFEDYRGLEAEVEAI